MLYNSRRFYPELPMGDDELTQGYFARNGWYHTGLGIMGFRTFCELDVVALRSGLEAFVKDMQELTPAPGDLLRRNCLERVGDTQYKLRGEVLDITVLRRSMARYCPCCVADDREKFGGRFNMAVLHWSWVLSPIVICPKHHVPLVVQEVHEPLLAFDPFSLENPVAVETHRSEPAMKPGDLQYYVFARLSNGKQGIPWLDNQSIPAAVKACQMLGSLIHDGQTGKLLHLTDLDWAHRGDIGFQYCKNGNQAIVDVLTDIRRGARLTSGRVGPQAVYKNMFHWLKKNKFGQEAEPMRDALREAIVNNFPIGPGETVLGKEIIERRVHNVNSLSDATGLSRFKVTQIARKVGLIPEGQQNGVANQWPIPAKRGEQLILRLSEMVPSWEIQKILSCTVTQADAIRAAKLIPAPGSCRWIRRFGLGLSRSNRCADVSA